VRPTHAPPGDPRRLASQADRGLDGADAADILRWAGTAETECGIHA
jgi:hypothetical protein